MNKDIIEKFKHWTEAEKALGSPNINSMVLATASANREVRSRVVAIREINEHGILFFTQKRSRKAKDLSENPSASMTLWLPLLQREVVFDGTVEALSLSENQFYWDSLPRERQLRFLTYKSGQPIDAPNELQKDYEKIKDTFHNKAIPVHDCYSGYRFMPHNIYFYTLGHETFSEVTQYTLAKSIWIEQQVSP